MAWRWSVGPGASTATPQYERELTAAFGRVLTLRVDGHAFASFSIDDRHDEARHIIDRVSDLWIWRDDTLAFRGRIVNSQHTIGPSAEGPTPVHLRNVQAIDYRGMLSKAALIHPPAPTFTGVDPAQIAWQLVQHAQGQTGGDWGITEGVGASTAFTRDLNTLLPGKPVGEAIDELMRRENGGEWEISPTLELNRWWPRRGADNGVVLDYGGLLDEVQLMSAEFANAAIATGSEQTSPATAETGDVGTDERGRWSVHEGFPSVVQQETLDAKAAWLRDEASTIERQWVARFAPGKWGGLDHVGLGDIVRFRCKSGSLNVASPHRVVEIQIVPGENGTETVQVGLVEEPEALS